jgi:dihydrodipicolinate synthase/N-acetylneuraminate lyase
MPLSDVEIRHFFAALQDALPEMKIVHYNIARAGRFLTGEDYRSIREVAPNLIGGKKTGGDITSLIDIIQHTPELDHFVVDGQIVPGALFGAMGFYSFVANLAPHIAKRLWGLCRGSQWEDAARLRERIGLLFKRWAILRGESLASPALGKIATRAGILPDMALTVRPPYQSPDERYVEALQHLVRESFPEFMVAH